MKVIAKTISLLLIIAMVLTSDPVTILAKESTQETTPEGEMLETGEKNSSDSSQDDENESSSDVEDADQTDLPDSSKPEISAVEPVEQGKSRLVEKTTVQSQGVIVNYRTHIQDIGWTTSTTLGASGVTNGANRLEALQISLASGIDGNINYSSHIQDIGWQSNVQNGAMSGTTGKSKRIEAIKISLSGYIATTYDVYYRVYVYGKGWMAWTVNGTATGTSGYATQLQAIEVKVLPKGDTSISIGSGTQVMYNSESVTYRSHVQNIGWQGFKLNGAVSGTTGQSKRIEALQIALSTNLLAKGGIQYRTHVQNIGWQNWVKNNEVTGTTGQSKRVEALEINLTGELANEYSIYYRTHVEGLGWLGWAKDGSLAGSTGCSRRVEAIEIKVIPKGLNAPSLGDAYTTIVVKPKVQYVPAYFSQHDANWTNSYYGSWSIGLTGCVPTSIAMAFKGLGINVNPNTIANYLYNSTGEFNKIFVGASGYAIQLAANHYGVKWQGLRSQGEINTALNDGKIIVALVNPGTFCLPGTTHAIVLHKNSSGNTYVYDSNNSSKNGWYNTAMLWNQKSSNSYDNRGGYVFYALSK